MLGSIKASSVEHPFLVNHLVQLWQNLVLGAGKGSGWECWGELPCEGCLQHFQAGSGFSDITGDVQRLLLK